MVDLILYFPLIDYLSDLYFTAILFFAILVLVSKSPIFSVLSLILVFILVSFCIMVIGSDFMGLMYVIVYAGAIAILFLFVLMLLNVRARSIKEPFSHYFFIWVIIIGVECLSYYYGLIPMTMFDLYEVYAACDKDVGLVLYTGGGDTSLFVGRVSFNIFFWYLILCAVILLVVMLGVVLLLVATRVISSGRSSSLKFNKLLAPDYYYTQNSSIRVRQPLGRR